MSNQYSTSDEGGRPSRRRRAKNSFHFIQLPMFGDRDRAVEIEKMHADPPTPPNKWRKMVLTLERGDDETVVTVELTNAAGLKRVATYGTSYTNQTSILSELTALLGESWQ